MSDKLPVSEIFVSPQGEGVYNGVMMCFIRLAGCNVGKPYPKADYQSHEEQTFMGAEDMPPKFKIYTEKCTLYDGRTFPCDTDYRRKFMLDIVQILNTIPENIKHVCISGGEPLIHDLYPLFEALRPRHISIETSGTRNVHVPPDVWVTVSPKFNCYLSMLNRADEIKILVDKDFDPKVYITCLRGDGLVEAVPILKLAEDKIVYLHPVNFENSVNGGNLKLCKLWQDLYPDFRIGIQMHKAMSMFLNTIIR